MEDLKVDDGEFYIFFVGRVGDVEVTIVVEGLGVAVAQGLVFAIVAAGGGSCSLVRRAMVCGNVAPSVESCSTRGQRSLLPEGQLTMKAVPSGRLPAHCLVRPSIVQSVPK